jgi:hypothetical protein
MDDPALEADDELHLDLDDLARLTADVTVEVEVWPLSGSGVGPDAWLAYAPQLEVRRSDIGPDAAIIGLAQRISDALAELLVGTGEQRLRLLPLLVKLWAADRRGDLADLLHRSVILPEGGPYSG